MFTLGSRQGQACFETTSKFPLQWSCVDRPCLFLQHHHSSSSWWSNKIHNAFHRRLQRRTHPGHSFSQSMGQFVRPSEDFEKWFRIFVCFGQFRQLPSSVRNGKDSANRRGFSFLVWNSWSASPDLEAFVSKTGRRAVARLPHCWARGCDSWITTLLQHSTLLQWI